MANAVDNIFSVSPTRFWIVAASVTAAKIAAIALSGAELGPDEAQYWFYAENPAFGYFSKPPLIAWAIALTTGVFGNAEWAVRLTAPLFHAGAAVFIYLLCRRAYDERIGFWAGVGWLVTPGVVLSSFVISTDAPLLFFWSGALFILHRIYAASEERRPSPLAFAALGAMIGLGLLSKYAMIYFPVALAAALAASRRTRAALLRPELFLAAAAAALLIAPNVAWNGSHGYPTVAHTAENAGLNAGGLNPLRLAEFLGAQAAVFGLVPAAAFLLLLARPAKTAYGRNGREFETTLIIFALTPLAIVSAGALLSQAHANWAAASYPAAMMLVTAWLFRLRVAWLAKASVAWHALGAVLFYAVLSNLAFFDQFGLARATKDLRGWRAQTEFIASKAAGFDTIVIDDRYLMAEALYYLRERRFEIVAIDGNAHIGNHFEAFKAFDPKRQDRMLFVSILKGDGHVNYRFRNITPLGSASVEFGGVARAYTMFDISGYYGPDAPTQKK